MKSRACARGLVAGAIGLFTFLGGTGVARADPDIDPMPGPDPIEQLVAETPALVVDTQDEGGPGLDWDGVGMYCQNLFVRCR
ncbi:hypothetical protein A5791_05835 [Mycobacterium sp. 852002-51163_SCH5372311]|uniref:hypothetical protein n=1 Tax=Mycobacterium sp. 852002-51163_SCH5372311 TaxID=1834097 RepID=UPI000801F797|nr:hypothetical protein [Mycobacterium sp. 852002-51163_SCH5372311]OBF81168.1 hypothetical protein A5791_05835 [Mycobacterium sp. 852002-51163_SCH5372311]